MQCTSVDNNRAQCISNTYDICAIWPESHESTTMLATLRVLALVLRVLSQLTVL